MRRLFGGRVLLACMLCVLCGRLASGALFDREARQAFVAKLRPDDRERLVELKSRAFLVTPVVAARMARAEGKCEVYVMFKGDLSKRTRARLEARGARTLGHVTGHTWRMEVPGLALLVGEHAVVGVEPVLPEDKLSPAVWNRVKSTDASAELELGLCFSRGTSREDALAALGGAGSAKVFDQTVRVSTRVPAGDVVGLASLPIVRYVELPPSPDVTYNRQAAAMHNVDDLWESPYGLSGDGISAAVRDTVVEPHVELGSRLTIVQGGTPAGHGIHVCGTIAGDGSVSNAAMGMAPDARIYAYDKDTGDRFEELTEALESYGARLSNHSYGPANGWEPDGSGGWTWYDYLEQNGAYSLDSAWQDSQVLFENLIVVRAAGNDRDDAGDGSEPHDGTWDGDGYYELIDHHGGSKNIICVGAVDASTNMSTFSSWGPMDDGRIKPDLVAKGVETLSLWLGNGHAQKGGTSMASPTVCGSIALLLEYYAKHRHGMQPPAALVKALLLNTTIDILRPGPDYQSGFGSLNIKAAVDMVSEETESYNTIQHAFIEHGETNHVFMETAWATNMRVTLVWSDPGGDPAAAKALVNDLDLVAISPDGVTHYPFIMPYAQVPGSSRTNNAIAGVNTRDNVEQIELHCPTNGKWRFDIKATGVPSGPQPYALVAHADQLPERFEPNDTFETAAYIGVGPGFHLRGISLHCGDEDWYRFRLVRRCRLDVILHGVPPFGLSLHDADGNELEEDSIAFNTTNVVVDTATLPAGTYYIHVRNTSINASVEPYGLDIVPYYSHKPRVFYVNSPAVDDPSTNSFYTLAPGSVTNDGLSAESPLATVGQVLARYDVGETNHIVVDTGTYTENVVITPADEGADYAGTVVGSLFDLDETVFPLNGVESNRFYHLHFDGDGKAFDLVNADHNVFDGMVVNNDNTGIHIADDAGSPSESNVVVMCAFTNDGTGIVIENSPDTFVASNRFDGGGAYGVQLVSGWSNTVLDNVFLDKDYAVHITDGDRDLIKGNRVDGGGAYGIYVNRAEKTVVQFNTILDRTYGAYIIGTEGNAAEVLLENNIVSDMLRGIYLAGDYTTTAEVKGNWVSLCTDIGIHSKANGNIHDNQVAQCLVGIRYDGAAHGAYGNDVHGNTTGLSGRGLLGGEGWSAGEPNDIYSNDVGVAALNGAVVQYNRVHDNPVGINANSSVSIHHNVIFRNGEQGILVDDDWTVSIVNNTVHNPTGDCVRVVNGSKNVSLRNNILWSAGGYDLYVANDSQIGFASDYNNFFTSGSGRILWWQKDFTDLLDWQVEAGLDNHSIGVTIVNPTLDDPLFLNAAGGDFQLGAGSTSIDAGDPASLYLNEPGPNGNRINLGAYGGTASAAHSPAQSVMLIYPQYYVDWPAYDVRYVQWTNFGLTGDADIDLYREGAGKIADLATVPLADGSYAWNPGLSSIHGDTTNRYRIRVTAANSPSHYDESREPFAIPISGTDYYVNDDNHAGDEYCWGLGGNRQTGMTPGDPKANVIGTLRSYALAPGDTVWIDSGDYLHVRNVTISASPGLGDDEGMVLTGPTQAFHHATIDRGNAFEEATTFDLNDADFVTMRHLTLTGGNVGILLRNESDNFSGSYVTACSNSLHGMVIWNNVAAPALSQLTVFDNGEDGIRAMSPIGTFSNCLVYGNGKVGVKLYASGDTKIEGCWVRNNETGIWIENEEEGTHTVVGHADLAAQRGNRVFDNEKDGIYAKGYVSILGNTITGNAGPYSRGLVVSGTTITTAWNVVHGNTDGIVSAIIPGAVEHNRVYNNSGWGIVTRSCGRVRRNVVYSNDGGILCESGARVVNNVIYHNATRAIRVKRAQHATIENNTIYAVSGSGVEVVDKSSGIKLRNNIFWANWGPAILVDPSSEGGFSSDYNLFHLTTAGHAGDWQSTPRSTLTDWKNATFGDASSFTANPNFVDADGADGWLAGDNGNDDDFHLLSPQGSYHGGSYAPLHGGTLDLPVYATAVETTDAKLSAAIDRGDGTYAYGAEPSPNGGFINLGAYGNTAQASKSPTEYVTVLTPSGGESWPAEQSFVIRWRSHDTNDTVGIELFDGAAPALTITNGAPNDGDHAWTVPASLPASNDYMIVVTRNSGISPSGTSGVFAVAGPVSKYYVNDAHVNGDGGWTAAPGDDANDGLSRATPKATVRGVLEAYDLDPGDIVYVDDGDYVLSQILLIADDDSGVEIRGYTSASYPERRALLNRNNALSTAVGVRDADGVQLKDLHVVGGIYGIKAYNDTDNLRVTGCSVYSNDYAGILIESGCDSAILSGNELWGYPGDSNAYDDQDRSIEVYGDGARILGNRVHDAGGSSGPCGIYAEAEDVLVEGNEACRVNSCGIRVDGQGVTTTVVRLNTCYSNTSYGITGIGNVRIEQNTCYGHYTYNSTRAGVTVSGEDALAVGNVCHHNNRGVVVSSAAHAEANRVYTNTWGIYVNGAWAYGNRAYGNVRGVYTEGGVLENNLIYDSEEAGVYVTDGTPRLRNNTVVESSADAIVAGYYADGMFLRNNILSVSGGAAVVVGDRAQGGFDSDYNLFHVSGAGRIGDWSGEDFTSRADGFFELGFDEHSLEAAPLFVDVDGPDDALGYDAVVGVDCGEDDNFHLQPSSPGIDQGTGYYLEEPRPNGRRANLGAYGNTPEAATSPDKVLQVLYPNGLEKFEDGQMVDIRWRAAGFAATGHVARINVGGDTVGQWLYCRYRTEGTSDDDTYRTIDLSGVSNPAPHAVYQTYAHGPNGAGKRTAWRLPVPDGEYGLRLHFVEPSLSQAGRRVFDIRLQGTVVIADYDIYVETGERYKAIAPSFSVSATGDTGIEIALENKASYGAVLSAIELVSPNTVGPLVPTVRLEYSADGGALWTTITSGVPVRADGEATNLWVAGPPTAGNSGLIRIRGGEPTEVYEDTSDNGFLVAHGGTLFYVNDRNWAGDLYTTALGDDLNSGRMPQSPMRSLKALLDAYDLDPGDTVYVDNGSYTSRVNLVIGEADAGVRIEGPPLGAAVIDRANSDASESRVFELVNADDTELVALFITGGYYGIEIKEDSERVRVQDCVIFANNQKGVYTSGTGGHVVLAGNHLYGIPGGASGDNQRTGLDLRSDDVQALGNTIGDSSEGIYVYAQRALIVTNTISGCGEGIDINGLGDDDSTVQANTIHDNSKGIVASGRCRVLGNVCHGNDGSDSAIAITVNGENAPAIGNVLYNNWRGLYVNGARAEGNRVYKSKGWAIHARGTGAIKKNHVYSNAGGILADAFAGAIEHNRIYANVVASLRVRYCNKDVFVRNNTIYALTGNAIELDASRDVVLRNNILAVDGGVALHVAGTAQKGLDCDYNLYHATGTGVPVSWAGTTFTNWLAWSLELGHDRHSSFTDPMFANPDGSDGVLGYDDVNDVDRGEDDNFHVVQASPAVDGGDPLSYYLEEPLPSGDRCNIGAYGNTSQATKSPAALVQVLYPNGYEKLKLGESVDVTWHTAGIAPRRTVARINAGGPTVGDWLYSAYQTEPSSSASASSFPPIDLSAVSNPAPAAVYERLISAERGVSNRLAWTLPVPDGTYKLDLHFNAPSYGERPFDIVVQGVPVVTNFNIYDAAGGEDKAVTRSFAVVALMGSGVQVELVNRTSPAATLCGLELTAANAGGLGGAAVDVDVAPDGTTWESIATNVALEAHGAGSVAWSAGPVTAGNTARVRVTVRSPAPAGADESDNGFLIGPGGNLYYVNDDSLAADDYAEAVGDNTNDGRTPSTPMASPIALLAAYDLGPGDKVYIDTGEYLLAGNMLIGSQDSGVVLQGATRGVSLLNRANAAGSSTGVEILEAPFVELRDLHISGGYRGVQVWSTNVAIRRCTVYANADCGIEVSRISDGTRLEGCTLYGIPGGGTEDDQDTGIRVTSDHVQIVNNLIHDGDDKGIDFDYYYAKGGEFASNTIFGFETGIYVSKTGADITHVHHNTVHHNENYGIEVSRRTHVTDNIVYGHSDSGRRGIYATGAEVLRNICYDNDIGIHVRDSVANDNRVFHNGSWGIETYQGAELKRNKVYSNDGGISVLSPSYRPPPVRIENNVVYDNANDGIKLTTTDSETELVNNTVYTPVGNALKVAGSSRGPAIRNNILWVDAGYCVYVESQAQSGFDCDYNVFYHGLDPNAHVGYWDSTDQDGLATWQSASAGDANTVFGPPKIVKRDGADDVLGYKTDGEQDYDGGEDDNFHLGIFSPAIDAADEPPAPLLDAEGNTRMDDATIPNRGTGSGIVEIGAYEFLGDSRDTNGPVVTATDPSAVHAETTVNTGMRAVNVVFSEVLDSIDAVAPANYELVFDSNQSTTFDQTDTVYELMPIHIAGSAEVLLYAAAGALPNGLYQLTIRGTGVHDVAGIALDGDYDSTPSGDYVRVFAAMDSGFAVDAEPVVTGGGSIQILFAVLPGFDYYVQYRDGLTDPPDWQDLPGGPHNSGAVQDDPPPDVTGRYYRVRRVPQ